MYAGLSAAAVSPTRDASALVQAAPSSITAFPQGQDPLLAARTKGARDAAITIYEIGDFQCPACRIFWLETMPVLESEYIEPGKVKLTFINFPLVNIHPNAAAAHELAMCGARQDKFWLVHDFLYRYQEGWAELSDPGPYLRALADSAALDKNDLEECLNNGSARWLVQADAEMSYNSGIRSTPSFVVEGGVIKGAVGIDIWRPLLDSIYAEKK